MDLIRRTWLSDYFTPLSTASTSENICVIVIPFSPALFAQFSGYNKYMQRASKLNEQKALFSATVYELGTDEIGIDELRLMKYRLMKYVYSTL